MYFIIYFHSTKQVISITVFIFVIPLQIILPVIWAKCDILPDIQYSYSTFLLSHDKLPIDKI